VFLELLLFEVVFGGTWEGVDRPLLMTPEFPGTCLDKEEEEEEDFELLFVFLFAISGDDFR